MHIYARSEKIEAVAKTRVRCLSLASQSACELDVLGLDGDSLGVDGLSKLQGNNHLHQYVAFLNAAMLIDRMF